MKIAFIGAGAVARALGASFAASGHEVVFGVRAPQEAATDRGDVATKTMGDAVQGADIVVLAVPFTAMGDLARALPLPPGRIVVDVSNPLRADPLGLSVSGEDSAGEQVQRLWPDARVVKAFNITGLENLGDPGRLGPAPALPVAGDDAEAKAAVMALAGDCGWRALDAGPIANARLIEAFAMLWIWLAYPGGMGRDFGFSVTEVGRRSTT